MLAHAVDANDDSSAIPEELAAASPTSTSANSDDQQPQIFCQLCQMKHQLQLPHSQVVLICVVLK